jgi:hypothetical protein
MRKRHMIGIFLLVLSFGLFAMCAWFEIGVGPENGTIYSWSDSSNPNIDFGYVIKISGPDYIEWYVWLPLALVALAGLACLIWPIKPTTNPRNL